MIVADMHYHFKLGVDKVDSLSAPNFLPEEIDILLNQAQDQFIENRAYGTNKKGEGVEETQKRLDDLKNITENYETTTFINNTSNKPNGVYVDLPTDYLHALNEEVSLTYVDCNNDNTLSRADVEPGTHDGYNTVIKKDPFNKPDKDKVYRLGAGVSGTTERFELITGSETINNYYLRYIRVPASITYGAQYVPVVADVNCELSNHTHREIVALAVIFALEDIGSQRYVTSKNEFNEIE